MLPTTNKMSLQRGGKSLLAFRTISEVANELDLPQHVLRFWETKFPQVTPTKRGGGRRYYRPEDIQILRRIRSLLYQDGYTIKGAQKLVKNRNQNSTEPLTSSPLDPAPPKHLSGVEIIEQMREVLSELEDIKNTLIK